MAKKKQKVTVFAKQQLLESNKYRHQRDVINVILQDDKTYSLEQVDKLIAKFMKEKVD